MSEEIFPRKYDVVKISKRDLARRASSPTVAGRVEIDEEGNRTIVVPKGVSSNVLLHEIGHARYSPDYPEDLDEYIREELLSDLFANEIKGKEYITHNHYDRLIWTLVKKGYSPNEIMSSMMRISKNLDFYPDRSYIWQRARAYYNEYRRKRTNE